VVKIFPAEFFGPAYIKSIKAPFPGIELMPTGGVTPETVGEFLRNGAFATAAGSSLVNPAALKAADWPAIEARARLFVAASSRA
jgi:2-dehydro-3-deoxyphosphogluconate aldolase/(4S)-4-hydroxy-2-oxoglutarate aldolase